MESMDLLDNYEWMLKCGVIVTAHLHQSAKRRCRKWSEHTKCMS